MPIAGTATSSANTAMYLAESDESHRPTRSLTGRPPPDLALTEAVRSVPVPEVLGRRISRDTCAQLEPGERSRPARDRAQSLTAREMKQAMAGRDGAALHVDGDVAVQRSRTGRLEVEDLRARFERLDVRGPYRAVGANAPIEARAVLRRVECLLP